MDKHIELSFLLEVYGALLTDRQKELMNYYYNEDLSLSEIASLSGTTRQSVHDLISRTEKILYSYEEKLGLLQRFLEAAKLTASLRSLICTVEQEQTRNSLLALTDSLDELF